MALTVPLSLALLVICSSAMLVWAGQDKVCRIDDYFGITQGQCGNQLDEVLSIVCDNRGFSEKRSAPDVIQTSVDTAHLEEVPIGLPFVSKATALSLLNKREDVVIGGVAYRRGITCECCVHKCAWGELEQYCLTSKEKRSASIRALKESGHASASILRFASKPANI